MKSQTKMRCHKVRRILWYQSPNKRTHQEKFAHYFLLLFYSFRDGKKLLSECLSTLYEYKFPNLAV